MLFDFSRCPDAKHWMDGFCTGLVFASIVATVSIIILH
jgi:hypothetical protein